MMDATDYTKSVTAINIYKTVICLEIHFSVSALNNLFNNFSSTVSSVLYRLP